MHEKPKLSMMKLIGECEVEESCAFLKSKAKRRMMLKLRGKRQLFRLRWEGAHGMGRRERRGYARSVTVGRWRMHVIGFCSALHGTIPGSFSQKPWSMEGSREDFPVKSIGERAALVLSLACKNYSILSTSTISSMWSARFF